MYRCATEEISGLKRKTQFEKQPQKIHNVKYRTIQTKQVNRLKKITWEISKLISQLSAYKTQKQLFFNYKFSKIMCLTMQMRQSIVIKSAIICINFQKRNLNFNVHFGLFVLTHPKKHTVGASAFKKLFHLNCLLFRKPTKVVMIHLLSNE